MFIISELPFTWVFSFVARFLFLFDHVFLIFALRIHSWEAEEASVAAALQSAAMMLIDEGKLDDTEEAARWTQSLSHRMIDAIVRGGGSVVGLRRRLDVERAWEHLLEGTKSRKNRSLKRPDALYFDKGPEGEPTAEKADAENDRIRQKLSDVKRRGSQDVNEFWREWALPFEPLKDGFCPQDVDEHRSFLEEASSFVFGSLVKELDEVLREQLNPEEYPVVHRVARSCLPHLSYRRELLKVQYRKSGCVVCYLLSIGE